MCCRIAIVAAVFAVLVPLFAVPAQAASSFTLSAPDSLVESGFLKHLLPRFSLKANTRIELVQEDQPAQASLASDGKGKPVFSGLGTTWYLLINDPESDGLAKFAAWISSDVGLSTIDAFKPANGQVFAAVVPDDTNEEVVFLEGDSVAGEKLAVAHCGRCHMVNEATRLTTIGSSPSFAVLRTFKDWQSRFETFFALRPHPAFTIIEDVTDPFDPSRPPPIAPVRMSLEDLFAILAFVSRIEPADLGAPIQYQ
ncbi:hypothetical protein GCM10009077_13790 [Roseibium denhamense]|uniref:Cytochrome c domain-containing protein n=1 Tax=Roseibium denhamense TaxID=76305 RepID=A0ABY1NGR8_9HYPH|nr:hypothetical protein SAMN06265374_1100 [Roseibium denhamense]